jgi:indolepyruvate ferredoxin oxidoreductase
VRFELALEVLRLPEQVRGYGPVKRAAAARARAKETALWQQWAAPAERMSEPRASAA